MICHAIDNHNHRERKRERGREMTGRGGREIGRCRTSEKEWRSRKGGEEEEEEEEEECFYSILSSGSGGPH